MRRISGRSSLAVVVCSLVLSAFHPVAAQILLNPVGGTFSSPLYITSAKDGTARLFIVEQAGLIKVLQPGATTPTIFLNITNKVVFAGEQGLLGLAFHPRYAVNRRFFVNYTRASDGATVVSRFTAMANNPNVASTQEVVLLTIPQPFANHNGGMIEFGPDGFLYIFTGDGGSANDPNANAQNINQLLGKVLRINVNQAAGGLPYSSPSGNPFFGNRPGRDEIFALGFRNPWRDSFDRLTGQLYVGDVGQDAFEEVDIVTRAGNYGWRVFEGNQCTGNDPTLCSATNFIPPIAQYDHGNPEVRCAITGGYVYRGARAAFPAGVYVFGDFCDGEIRTLNPPAPGGVQSIVTTTGIALSSFGEDEAAELYAVDHDGIVNRITRSPAPPACVYSITPTNTLVSASARTGNFSLTTTGDCGWMARSHQAWLTITSASSGVGSATINFSVVANPTGRFRQTTITVAGQTFTVRQSP